MAGVGPDEIADSTLILIVLMHNLGGEFARTFVQIAQYKVHRRSLDPFIK